MISKWWQAQWDWQKPALKPKAPGGQREFEIRFYEAIVARQSDYWEVLSVLGNHYTAAKRYKDGLHVDERLAALRPRDAIVYYNLACSYCLLGRIGMACDALERALSLGYRDYTHILRDPDLEKLRADKRFKRLLGRFVKV